MILGGSLFALSARHVLDKGAGPSRLGVMTS
jgi:hypothetical protein